MSYDSLISSQVVAAITGNRFWSLLFSFLYELSLNLSKSDLEQNQSFSYKSVLLLLIYHKYVTTPSANQTLQ